MIYHHHEHLSQTHTVSQEFRRFARIQLTKAQVQDAIPEFDPHNKCVWTEKRYAEVYLQSELSKRPKRPVYRRFVPDKELRALLVVGRQAVAAMAQAAADEAALSLEQAAADEAALSPESEEPPTPAVYHRTESILSGSMAEDPMLETKKEKLHDAVAVEFMDFIAKFPSEFDREALAQRSDGLTCHPVDDD